MVAGRVGLVNWIVSRVGWGRRYGEAESIGLSRPAI